MFWGVLLALWVLYTLWWFDDRGKKRAARDAVLRQSSPTGVNLPEPKITFTIERIDDSDAVYTPPKSRARKPGRCSMSITYTDSGGVTTTREISVYKSGATNRSFDAWCSLRHDRRTFVFNRVDQGIDLETGEILSRVDIYKRIHPARKVPEDIDW